ncbi:hypothetical protein ABK040_002247 [Willaertia magna]
MLSTTTTKTLLVIDYNSSTDWSLLFKNKLQQQQNNNNSQPINFHLKVEQAGWEDIRLINNSSFFSSNTTTTQKNTLQNTLQQYLHVELKAKPESELKSQRQDRTIQPDFLLIRNFPNSLHGDSYRNLLLGFMHANIPSVNSLDSIFMCSEKPLVYGKLKNLQKKLGGFENFPLIPQIYYPNIKCNDGFEENEKTMPQEFPVVCKIGTVHAGFGKQKLNDSSNFSDFTTCLALTKDYFTCEPFCKITTDLRLQKIGNNYRVYERKSDSNWKNNWGAMRFKHLSFIEERYKIWMDEVSSLFGGLDMFTLDVMKLEDGSERIIELNDSCMGLLFEYEKEDNNAIVELVVERMKGEFN